MRPSRELAVCSVPARAYQPRPVIVLEFRVSRIGVCSWSLKPRNPANLAAKVRACGLSAVQLALDPIRRAEWPEHEVEGVLRDAGIDILSGMMATRGEDYSTLQSIQRTGGLLPDQNWEPNLAAAK